MTLHRSFVVLPRRRSLFPLFLAALAAGPACERRAERHFRAAQDARYRGDPRSAVVEYRLAREAAQNEDLPEGERIKTRSLWEAGDATYVDLKQPAEAAALYRELIAAHPQAPEALPARVKLAEILRVDLDDLPGAVSQLAAAIALKPSASLHYELAKLYFAAGNYGSSATECDAILRQYGSSSNAARAALLEAQALQMIDGRTSEAIRLLDQLVAHPSAEVRAFALLELGRMQGEAGHLESAIEHLVRALRSHPNPAIVQSAIASARRRLEKEAGAGDRVADMILANAVLGGLSTLRQERRLEDR